MPFIKNEDSPIFYESKGNGDAALILIPGFASGAWTWFAQTDELANNFRLITYDPRGIGRSVTNAPDDISMETFLADVLAILDELGIEKTHVLGASFGGFVALALAQKFPERVRRMVLACTTAGGAQHVKPDVEILRSFTRNPEMTLGQQIRHFFKPAFTEDFHRKHAETVEKVCVERESNDVSDETYLAQLQTAFSFDVDDELARIEIETLVITGTRDLLVPMENSVNLASKLPNARLKIIENGSHMFFIENAAEFNREVKDFLRND